MKIFTGVDLVYLPRFKKTLKSGGEKFLRRVYLENELIHLRGGEVSAAYLGGIFAAKEAVMKALSLKPGSWHDIQVRHQPNGAPRVEIVNCKLKIESCSLSISHDGNYVIAQFTAILKV